MKKLAIVLAILTVLILLTGALWSRFRSADPSLTAYTTTVQLSGTTNGLFSGHYVRNGKRVTISGALPWSLSESNLSRLEIRKGRLEDTLVLDARGGGNLISAKSDSGFRGLIVDMEEGWSFELIK